MTDQQERVETHTAEPWHAQNTSLSRHFWAVTAANIYGSEFNRVASSRIIVAEIKQWSDKPELESEADARRIVACVNACQGVDTETLETLQEHGVTLSTASPLVKARADEAEALLVEGRGALQNILNGLSVDPHHDQDEVWGNAMRKANAFLAKMEARKP